MQLIRKYCFNFYQGQKNLQTLILIAESKPEIDGFFCDAVHDGTLTNYSRGRQLRLLELDGWKNSSLLLQTMPLMSGIRQIRLENCDDLLELPSIPLGQLELLYIYGCHNLQSFSKQSVEGWCNLKELHVFQCGNIREVPDELGGLPELKTVVFSDCKNLQKFASLCNPNGPLDLVLFGCDRLRILPPISCQLGTFWIRNAPITSLNVDENAWKLLSVFRLEGCEFEVLPESGIYRATAVQVISLDSCKQLRELPDGIEGLQSLRRLSLQDCHALERLPSPALGNCQSLQELSVAGCHNLVEVPDEIGSLTSLIKLDVSGCKNLKRLPSTIGSALSLQELNARKCEMLVKLPDEIGKLASLIVLDVSGCKKLKQLPAGCIGNLTSLIVLDVSGCKKLKQLPLPAGIRNALSLKKLFASGCKHLVELPDELGKLSLTHLDVSFSSNLEEFISRSTARQDFVLLNSLRCLSVCELPKLDDTWKFALGMRGCGDESDIPDNLAGLTELRLSSSRSLVVNREILDKVGVTEEDSESESPHCDTYKGYVSGNFYVNLFELPTEIELQQLPGSEELACAFPTELKRLKKDPWYISRTMNIDYTSNLSVLEGKIPKIKLTHLHLCSVISSITPNWDVFPALQLLLRHSIVYSSRTAGTDGLSKWPN